MTRQRALVHGWRDDVARALLARRYDVVIAVDHALPDVLEGARRLGIDLYEGPSAPKLERLVERTDIVVPLGDLAADHPLVVSAQRLAVPLRSELEVAGGWESARIGGARPILAVVGAGASTVAALAAAALDASGVAVAVAGARGPSLMGVLDGDVEVFVIECTTAQLAWAPSFRPAAGAWLNATDGQSDAAAIWLHQQPFDAAIGPIDDPVVMDRLAVAPGRHVTFGVAGADYHLAEGWLAGPQGRLAEVASMRDHSPEALLAALAASALALEPGLATVDGVALALAAFDGPQHHNEQMEAR